MTADPFDLSQLKTMVNDLRNQVQTEVASGPDWLRYTGPPSNNGFLALPKAGLFMKALAQKKTLIVETIVVEENILDKVSEDIQAKVPLVMYNIDYNEGYYVNDFSYVSTQEHLDKTLHIEVCTLDKSFLDFLKKNIEFHNSNTTTDTNG